MSTFAKIDTNNIVTETMVAEQDFIDLGLVGDSSLWIPNLNKAGIGYTYDKVNEVFYPPQPFPSWSLDSDFNWQPPTPLPELDADDKRYNWNEDTQAWDEQA
jgi:hypothetical protein